MKPNADRPSRTGRRIRTPLWIAGGFTGLFVAFFLVTDDFDFGSGLFSRSIGDLFRILFFGLIVSLAASVIFDWVYVQPQQEEAKAIQKREINKELRKNTREVTAIVLKLNPVYYPKALFLGTSEPDPAFNRAISRHLLGTSSYYFQGNGGEWTAMRLRYNSIAIKHVTIVLPNLDKDSPRYQDWLQYEMNIPRNRNANRSRDDIERRIGGSVASAIVGLFDSRETLTVRINFSNSDLQNRLEIFDDVAYVCAFDRQDPNRAAHPETVMFDKDSFSFPFLCNLADNPKEPEAYIDINRNTTEAEIKELLLKLNLLRDGVSIDSLRVRFKNFEERNRHYINSEFVRAEQGQRIGDGGSQS